MTHKNNVLKALIVLLSAACIILAAVCFCVPKSLHHAKMFIPTSDNEVYLTLQQKYERHLEQTILKLLEPLVGRGKVQASAQVELNLKNARHVIRSYEPKLDDQITSKQTTEKEIRNFIQKQHFGIVIDGTNQKENKGIYQPRTQQEMSNYRRLIQSAIGYDASRGDTLEIQNIPFTTHPRKKHPSVLILRLLLGIVGIVLIILSLCCAAGCKNEKNPAKTEFSPDILDKINENPTRAITVIKNWIYMPEIKKNTDWSPIQKVGIVLLALDETIVRQILINLDDNEVRKVAKTMTTLGVIPPQESARILAELYEAMKNGSAVVGNPARVQQILSESPNEETLKFKETLQTPHSSLWQELSDIPTNTLSPRLNTLRPEITAYILYRLPTQKASDILQDFPENKTTQVLIHLSHIGHISPTTSAKMEQEALSATRDILNTIHTPTGTEKTSEILSQLSKTQTGQAVLKDINVKEPFLARKLAAKLIRFDDLAGWKDQNIQILLRHTPRATAIAALVNTSDNIKQAIRRNIPASLWTQLENEIATQQKQLSEEQIQSARQQILDNIKMLLNQGKIQL